LARVSEYPATGPLTGDELAYVVQDSASKNTTVAAIAALGGGSGEADEALNGFLADAADGDTPIWDDIAGEFVPAEGVQLAAVLAHMAYVVIYDAGWPADRPLLEGASPAIVFAMGHTSPPSWLGATDFWFESVV
jgi:hypothetical protein